MKIAYLTVGNLSYYLPPDRVAQVMADAVEARAGGEWFQFDDAGGNQMHLLIPDHAVLAVQEYEVEDAAAESDPNDWMSFDFDS